MRTLSVLLVAAAALVLPVAASAGRTASIFYYPWYGNGLGGSYGHWSEDGHAPPYDIASSYYPARGAYSSGDPAVIRAQMAEIAASGVREIVVSWWGWGSAEDLRLPSVVEAARARGLAVAVHIEPYLLRSAPTVEGDIAHLRGLGVSTFYVYRPFETIAVEDWAALTARLEGILLFAETPLAGLAAAAGFDGLYTYDTLSYDGESFRRICNQAHVAGILCAPSVGPGYDARRSLRDLRFRPRRHGATYDAMWQGAIAAGADLVTITSYNEWIEGTQIEPARVESSARGFVYANYHRAWGLKGKRAERSYLSRTAFWTAQLVALR